VLNTARFMSAFILLSLFLNVLACGRKGPPFLPRKEFPVRVTDLEGDWVRGDYFLKGDITDLTGQKTAVDMITGCRVYYGRYPLGNPPCDGCPITYQGYYEFGREVITEEGFFCKAPGIIQGQINFFKVHLIGPDGSVGPSSDSVQVVVKE
jgi:predicted small lipoprotein YifL